MEIFIQHKHIAPQEAYNLVTAMLTQEAQDWLRKLPGDKKGNMDLLKASFETRYIKPPVLKFHSSYSVFRKTQADKESVEDYVRRLRAAAKRVDLDDKTLLYAFVSNSYVERPTSNSHHQKEFASSQCFVS